MLPRKIVFAVVLAIVCAALPLGSQEKNSEAGDVSLAPLSRFIGDWDCSGKFASSNKVIEAHVGFKYDLEGKWIFFRHDDKPPFAYHALAEWGWDRARNEFVMFVEDSGGGIRKFHAPGSPENQIIWTGDALHSPAAEDQRLVFEIRDANHFQFSYFSLKGASWRLVDSSTCSK
jgi:hypothetical protein